MNKFKVRAVLYALVAVGVLLVVLGSFMGVFFMLIDSSASLYSLALGSAAILVMNVLITGILFIKSKRLFRLKNDEVLRVSKFENIFLAILMILAWVILPMFVSGEKTVRPLDINNPSAQVTVEEKIKSISPTVSALPQDVLQDLSVAYGVLRMQYEQPTPATDLNSSFVYTECAKHIVDEVALAKLPPLAAKGFSTMTLDAKFTSFKSYNFVPQQGLFLAIQSLVGTDVGYNKVLHYTPGGLVSDDLEKKWYSPSVEACSNLNIPDKYKS